MRKIANIIDLKRKSFICVRLVTSGPSQTNFYVFRKWYIHILFVERPSGVSCSIKDGAQCAYVWGCGWLSSSTSCYTVLAFTLITNEEEIKVFNSTTLLRYQIFLWLSFNRELTAATLWFYSIRRVSCMI